MAKEHYLNLEQNKRKLTKQIAIAVIMGTAEQSMATVRQAIKVLST